MPWWVFRGSEIFSRGYFVGPKFLSWVFVGPKFFLRSIFVGPKFSRVYPWVRNFFLVSISWVQFFFLVVDFVIQRFSVAGYISKSVINRNTKYILNHVLFSTKVY